MKLGLSEHDSQQYLLLALERDQSSESGQFQGLPAAILSCLLSGLRTLLKGRLFQSQRKLLYNMLESKFFLRDLLGDHSDKVPNMNIDIHGESFINHVSTSVAMTVDDTGLLFMKMSKNLVFRDWWVEYEKAHKGSLGLKLWKILEVKRQS